MMIREQVFAQAMLLAGELDERQQALLRVLCMAAQEFLAGRLREDVSPESCREAFIAAAGLLALADLRSAGESGLVEEFKAGDLTVKQGTAPGDGAKVLQAQAQRLMGPYLKDCFAFLGV